MYAQPHKYSAVILRRAGEDGWVYRQSVAVIATSEKEAARRASRMAGPEFIDVHIGKEK